MLKSIVNYVNYHYQLCENIDSAFFPKMKKLMNVISSHV